MILPLLLAAAAPQAHSGSDRLPPANPLPPPGSDEEAVLAPVRALLAGLAARDGAAVLAQVRPEGLVTDVAPGPDGRSAVGHFTWASFASGLRHGPERLEAPLTGAAVEQDGDVAFVWSSFGVREGGRLVGCGSDLFDLVREGGRWRVLNLTVSERSRGCADQ